MEPNGIIEALTDTDSLEASPSGTSDYESSLNESMFGSLTSSVNEHVWEYGRRYHKFRYGRYPLPNDDDEFKREFLRHIMLKEMTGGKLHLAPVGDNPQKIIDLGTGFGHWPIEVGELFPCAMVIGVDLSPIQPVWIPPNVEFMVDDIEDEWVHDSDFDFMHLRFTGWVIKDIPKLFRTAFQNLKPGGWIEVQDICPKVGSDDGTVQPDNPLARFYSLVHRIFLDKYQADIRHIERVPEDLERAGFVNVQKRIWNVPVGEWAKDAHLRTMGGYFREIIMDLVVAMAARPFVEAGLEKTEIDELVNSIRAAMGNKRIHAYLPIHSVWAQKPPS
ncbi:S-adenosyl-L-methionine-dependent methyltransferase [Podospora appendiculata]|uniref:S-adenosyl-L-methionine-dependent methyltransferase n=1 Tax=Podospora appendiculata TaxID=314037 RepID=A0AAE0X7N4_9PEZI|nr:S-adenosyl-L-methionine-dependent methyltransferase [Podospora appendiculata]